MQAKEWTVHVYLTEDDDETSARAVFTTRDNRLVGLGHSRRNPADRPMPEIGDELAAGRALADLATKLLATASAHITRSAGPTEARLLERSKAW